MKPDIPPQGPKPAGDPRPADLDDELQREMSEWEAAGLRRRLDDLTCAPSASDFVSNDYLGLSRHPEVIEAARAATLEFGAGGRAARLLGGGCTLHDLAEVAVVDWLRDGPSAGASAATRTEAALLFPSGYQANLGLITALAGPGDALVSDEACHASIIDACRLSRARILVHAHLDLDQAERHLRAAAGARRRLLITEGVFSMDGDAPPLLELARLCVEHDAWLIVDEAHSAGVVGGCGRGAWARACAEAGADELRPLAARLAARVVTGGKALGVAGAFVVSSRVLREHLVNRARAFVFTTAVPPAVPGALIAAVRLAASSDELREAACGRAARVAGALGLPAPAAAIVPYVIGDSARALGFAARLSERGLQVRAVRPPTVPEGTARMRFAFHAYNSENSVQTLLFTLQEELGRRLGEPCRPSLKGASRPAPAARARPAPSRDDAARRLTRVLAVVGTDTCVGKTVVAALLMRAAARATSQSAKRASERRPVVYWKPVQTGEESDTGTVERLAAGLDVRCEAPSASYPLPASPHEAAAAAGGAIDVSLLRRRFWALRDGAAGGTLIVEPAGGLLVPLDELHTQADLLAAERPGIVLVARSGLGTLNHTLLTIEALEARGLRPLALFLVGEPHRSNRDTLAARSTVPAVYELPCLEPLDAAALDGWADRYSMEPILGSCA